MLSVTDALSRLEHCGGRAELLADGKARLHVPALPGAREAAAVLRADPIGVKSVLHKRSLLKGSAIELRHDGMGRLWIVADEADAAIVIRRGAERGQVWTSAEIEIVARIEDQATRDEIARFKARFNGTVNEVVTKRTKVKESA